MNDTYNPTGDWDFNMWLKVNDPDALFAAARAHPDCHDVVNLVCPDGSVDIQACLVMLLDNPIPGCTVQSSGAAPADV